jgi:processive 1,2-diacylglycerol beta-glucosyltransferase
MKKILIFTAGFGEGHNTAARNIRDALDHIAPNEAKVEVLDLFDICYGKLNDLVRKAYITAINRTPRVWGKIYNVIDGTQFVESNMVMLAKMKRAMSDVLADLEPDAVVSTYPIYNYVIDAIYADGRPKMFSQMTVITDSITVNSIWYRCVSDYFLVANEDTANVLRNAGVPEQQIRVFGFPVTYRFAEMPDHRYDSGQKGPRRILYLINSGKKEAPALVRRLCKRTDIQLTINVGRDRALRKEIESEIKAPAHPVEILGWSNRMPELLMGHHLVITKAGGATVQEAIAARTPVIISQVVPGQEEGNARLVVENECGCLAPDPEAILEALDSAFNQGENRLQTWVTNISKLSKPDASLRIARFLLELASPENAPPKKLPHFLRTESEGKDGRSILLCDLHTHSTYSDGKLSVRELVDFYGQRSFDAVCVTDHICDHTSFIGQITNFSGMVLTLDEVDEYFETIENEKKRALERYGMILMAGLEFNKDGLTKKSSAHLLAVDLKEPIDPGLSITQTIAEIHGQGALAIASHPHEVKTRWGKNTLYFWENIDRYAPLLDAWEVANRDDLFNPIGLKRLPFVANSDFHRPKHIFSWKTVLFCEKDPETIKQCIRVNRDVSITLYRDHRIGFGYGDPERAARLDFAAEESAKEVVAFPTYRMKLAR